MKNIGSIPKACYSFLVASVFLFCNTCHIQAQEPDTTRRQDLLACYEFIHTLKSEQDIIKCLENILNKHCEDPFLGDSMLMLINITLANSFYDDNATASAQSLFYAKTAITHAERFFGHNSLEVIRYWNSLAFIHQNFIGSISDAISIRKHILEVYQNSTIELPSLAIQSTIFNNLTRLAELYSSYGKKRLALTYFQEAQQIRSPKIRNDKLFSFDLLYSNFLYQTGDLDQAIEILHNQLINPSHSSDNGIYKNTNHFFIKVLLAQGYILKKQPNRALQYILEAEQLSEVYSKGNYQYQLYLLKAQSQVATALQEYEKAENYINSAISILENINTGNYNQWNVLTISEFQTMLAANKQEEFNTIKKNATLEQGLIYAEEAIRQFQTALGDFDNRQDQTFHLHEYYPAYEITTSILYDLYHATGDEQYFFQAIQISDEAKNMFHRDRLRRYEVAEGLGIPDSYFEEEKEITQLIHSLEIEKRKEAEKNTPDSQRVLQINDSLQLLQRNTLALNQKIRADYPQYFEHLSAESTLNTELLLQQLSNRNETLLQYAVNDKETFLIVRNKAGGNMFKIEIGLDSVNTLVNAYQEAIYQVQSSGEPVYLQKLHAISARLYSIFLTPAADLLTENLLISTDGPLEMLPFSALVKGQTLASNLPEWDFVLKDHCIRYTYQVGTTGRTSRLPQNVQNKILAFAPEFEDVYLASAMRSDIGRLENNQDEVRYIEETVTTKAFYRENATLNTFLKYIDQYRIVHLATHAVADEEFGQQSYLLFSEDESTETNRLDVGQLYTMQIPADLVVLSACETSIGEWRRGEGLVGLERAFAQAGVQSVISTKWKVSDKESSKLMGLFYEKIAEGLPKDQALRQAQLEFMEVHPHRTHPFFWAAYVLTGDASPINISAQKNRWWYWIIAGFGILAIPLIYRQYQRAA